VTLPGRNIARILASLAVVFSASCAGNVGGNAMPPNTPALAGARPAAITQSPPPDVPIAATGTVAGLIKGEGFVMQTGLPHGLIDVEVTNSTSVTGGTLVAGDHVSVNGTGTWSTFILATSVSIVGPTPTPSPAPTPAPLPSVIALRTGAQWGTVPTLWPTLGSDVNGGHGQTIDGLSCGAMVDNSFHVHAFLGVLVNGVPMRVPPGIGVKNPGPLVNGFLNSGTCFYSVHTHDADGYIHMEALSSTPLSGSLFTLGNVLDMWGEQITPVSFGPYSGQVRVFETQAALRNVLTPAGGWHEITSTTGLDWDAMALYSHSAVMIEVGPYFVDAPNLPQVQFDTEY
jgi:hypothetical protein